MIMMMPPAMPGYRYPIGSV